MPSLSFHIIGLSFVLDLVSAHGFVRTIAVDGVAYPGLFPGAAVSTVPKNAIRQVTEPSPVKGALNAAVNCGHGAKQAASVIDVLPGSKLEFTWSGWDGSRWPHNTGPMLTYMANCGSVTCDKFDSTKAKWFKVGQVGRKGAGQPWVQSDLMSGLPSVSAIPATLAPGNYLIRHEIIALHLASVRDGAEFYPSCTQVRVGGQQKGVPNDNDLVSLPGAYSDTDKGIWVPAIYDSSAAYVFPGPPVATLYDGPTTNNASPTTTTQAASSTTTAAPNPTNTPTKVKGVNPVVYCDEISSRDAEEYEWEEEDEEDNELFSQDDDTPSAAPTSIAEEQDKESELESDAAFLARKWESTLERRRHAFGWSRFQAVVPKKRRHMHRVMNRFHGQPLK